MQCHSLTWTTQHVRHTAYEVSAGQVYCILCEGQCAPEGALARWHVCISHVSQSKCFTLFQSVCDQPRKHVGHCTSGAYISKCPSQSVSEQLYKHAGHCTSETCPFHSISASSANSHYTTGSMSTTIYRSELHALQAVPGLGSVGLHTLQCKEQEQTLI